MEQFPTTDCTVILIEFRKCDSYETDIYNSYETDIYNFISTLRDQYLKVVHVNMC